MLEIFTRCPDGPPGAPIRTRCGGRATRPGAPLTDSGSGDRHCLDLDPAPGGSVGQVILMWHDSPERPWSPRASSR